MVQFFYFALSRKALLGPVVRLDPFDARGADNQQGADSWGTEGKGGGRGGGEGGGGVAGKEGWGPNS